MTDTVNKRSTENGLRPNSLGVAGIVFFVVAAASPLSAILGASPPAIGLGTGAGAPSAYLFTGALLLVFSVGYSAMSRSVAAGGGFAGYVQAAMGDRAGRGAGYLALVAYMSILAGLYGIFGVFANTIAGEAGLDVPWYIWSASAWVLVGILTYFDVDLSAKVLGSVMVLEVVVLLVVSVAIVVAGGTDGLNLASFTPSLATGSGFGVTMMFAFASFVGFEATAIYSEEARNQDRTIPRATYVAVTVITVFLVFTVWSFVIGYGVDGVRDAAIGSPDEFVFGLAETYVGPLWATIMMALLVTSFFAALVAFQNTIARYIRALALRSWLPASLAVTHAKYRSPHIAGLLTCVVSALLVAAFVVTGQDPYTTLYLWFVGIGTLAVVSLQTLTSIAIVVYFRRNTSEYSVWRTLIAPAVGAVGLVIAVLLIVDNWPLLVGADDAFAWALPWIVPLALGLGLVLPRPRRANTRSENH